MEAVGRTSFWSTCPWMHVAGASSRPTLSPGSSVPRVGSRLTFYPHPALTTEAAWSAWGPWGSCSGSCGPGRRLRRRRCSSPAENACPGRPLEAQKCVRPRCPGRRGRGQLRGELRKEGAWVKGGARVQRQAWRARTWFTGRLALPSLSGPRLSWSIGDSVHLDWRTPGGAFPVVGISEGVLPPCARPSV